MSDIHEFIKSLPKAELHLHIEGSLEPEQMFKLAKRNNIELPYGCVEDIRRAYQFNNLQEFLDIYYQGMSVLQTRRDFFDLTYAYLRRVSEDNCKHVEIFFDPQGHTERGVDFSEVIEGILDGLAAGEKDFGVSSHLIMSFLRHLCEESAFETLAQAEPYIDRLLGVGLDSSEMGHPPSKFQRVFEAAAAKGLKRFAHAGEEGPPEYVYEALNLLKVDRIDHGNRSLEDAELVTRIRDAGLTLTVCPLSNLKLCVVEDLAAHPMRKMLNAGLLATVNSDDPSYFGGYLNDNYVELTDALDLSKYEIAQLAKNSFTGSYLSSEQVKEYVEAIEKTYNSSK